MLKKAYIILLFSFLYSTYGCNSNNDLKSSDISLLKAYNITIIDSLEYNKLNIELLNNKFQIPSKNYIYSLLPEENILYKYEFGKSNFEKILEINTSFRIVNYYIDAQEKYISCLIDNDIDDIYILKVIDLNSQKVLFEKNIPEHSDYVLSNFYPHVLINGKDFYISCMPKLINYPPGYTEKYIQMHWDIQNDILEILPITYPNNYHHKYFGVHYNVDRVVINDSIHAFSFLFNDSIFLYNTNTKKIKSFFAGTRQPYTFPNIFHKDLSMYHEEIKMDIAYNSSLYFQMSYIHSKEIYLRFFKNEDKIYQILYDKDFNYLGEITEKLYGFYGSSEGFHHIQIKDKKITIMRYDIHKDSLSKEIAQSSLVKIKNYNGKYLKENFDAGVQKFLEKTKLIPNKEDSVIIYQSTHCAACVQSAALEFLKQKDNKNISIIVFDEKDKEMLSNHIFSSPIVLCEDNSLSKDGYYHHMPHMYFWKGNKVTSSPIVEEKNEENI